MGFDLFGRSPRDTTGEYFRNNVWYWRPLWRYVVEQCAAFLTPEEQAAGDSNACCEVSAKTAERIDDRLSTLLASGAVARHAERWEHDRAALPDEPCGFCDQTGVRHDEYVQGTCNACGGKGSHRPLEAHYPFSVENVQAFVAFLRSCGGFRIC